MSALTSPASERNKEPILQVLRSILPESGTVLEIASGTGQHVAHFAPALPKLHWRPTDIEPLHLASITAYCRDMTSVADPLMLNVCDQPWPITNADAVFCSNMIHIAPAEATTGLLRGAGRVLASNAPLVLYGPFKRNGEHTAPSNAAFDQNLRHRNSNWGIRNLECVVKEAAAYGLALDSIHAMPANNLAVVFRKRADA